MTKPLYIPNQVNHLHGMQFRHLTFEACIYFSMEAHVKYLRLAFILWRLKLFMVRIRIYVARIIIIVACKDGIIITVAHDTSCGSHLYSHGSYYNYSGTASLYSFVPLLWRRLFDGAFALEET